MTIGPPQSVWVQEEYNQKSEMKQALIGMTKVKSGNLFKLIKMKVIR